MHIIFGYLYYSVLFFLFGVCIDKEAVHMFPLGHIEPRETQLARTKMAKSKSVTDSKEPSCFSWVGSLLLLSLYNFIYKSQHSDSESRFEAVGCWEFSKSWSVRDDPSVQDAEEPLALQERVYI